MTISLLDQKKQLMPLSIQERLQLINKLNGLPLSKFLTIETALAVPVGVMPEYGTPLGQRTAALFQWLEGSLGPGLEPLIQLLSRIEIEVAPSPGSQVDGTNNENGNLALKLAGDLSELDANKINQILSVFQGMAEDFSIEIKLVKKGSIEIKLYGSVTSLERIKSLIDSGEISQVYGLDIEEIFSVKPIQETKGLDLSFANLRGFDLSSFDLSEANLRSSDLSEANLVRTNINNANLSHSNLSHAILIGTTFKGSNLNHSDLNRANLSGSDLSSANLRDANFNDANFNYSRLNRANLNGSDLSGSDFSHANLSWANLSQTNLSWTNFCWVNLTGTNFYKPKIHKTLFRDVSGMLEADQEALSLKGAIFIQKKSQFNNIGNGIKKLFKSIKKTKRNIIIFMLSLGIISLIISFLAPTSFFGLVAASGPIIGAFLGGLFTMVSLFSGQSD